MARESRDTDRQIQEHQLATRRFYFLITMLALILIFVAASIVLWLMTPRPEAEPEPPSTDGGLFSVTAVTVEGNTKYLEESVIGESGVLIGQSIFAVESNDIEAHLLEVFPYFETVEVQTLHMDEVKITVTETAEIGVIYSNGSWVPVGANGKALDEQEISSDKPKGMLYIKGTTPPEGGVRVGGQAMDDYSASVLQTLLAAINQYTLTDVVEIDLSDMSDIRMNWRDQIEIRLGNTSNLTHEIGVVATTIPEILKSRGEHATGVLNVSSYSNDALENQAVFTPSSLIPTTTTASRRPADDGTTTTPHAESGVSGDEGA